MATDEHPAASAEAIAELVRRMDTAENECQQLRDIATDAIHIANQRVGDLQAEYRKIDAARDKRHAAAIRDTQLAYESCRDDVNDVLDVLTEHGCPPEQTESAVSTLRRYLDRLPVWHDQAGNYSSGKVHVSGAQVLAHYLADAPTPPVPRCDSDDINECSCHAATPPALKGENYVLGMLMARRPHYEIRDFLMSDGPDA
jgi:hypothetical protein